MKNKALYAQQGLTKLQLASREVMMSDLGSFVAGAAPYRVLGHCHKDLLKYLCLDEDSQLILWPRGHQKSTMLAFWCAWWIIKYPETSILYASATADLAELQLGLIKTILSSKFVKKYWPELLPLDSDYIWRQKEITVGHWKREYDGMRDYTLKALGVGGKGTGQHYDVVLLDDLVDETNSQEKADRDKLSNWFSFLTSIINDAGITKVVGTRYHPKDLYDEMISMKEDVVDDDGMITGERDTFTVSSEVVEEDGQYLWPRQQRTRDGKWFGFDAQVLAKKRAKYAKHIENFYSQYYNDPSNPESHNISSFQYYKKEHLTYSGSCWEMNGRRLNAFAAIDFAATITKRADYTAIIVVGIDWLKNIYVLDIDRFKTDKISFMTKRLAELHAKWGFKLLRGETTGQQNLVVEQIKENNRDLGVRYKMDKNAPCTNKRIRINSNLEPIYEDERIFHCRGGLWEILETELSSERPPHIDIADVLAAVVEIIKAPMKPRMQKNVHALKFNSKHGGVA